MQNFRISALCAHYVGPFENLSLQLKEKNNPNEAEVHVFTGENGTGKSTILYLLTAFANEHLVLPRIQKDNYANFKLEIRFSTYSQDNIGEVLPFETLNLKYENGLLIEKYENGQSNNRVKLSPIQEYLYSGKTHQVYKNQFAFFAYSGYRSVGNAHILNGIKELENIPLENALNFNESIDANHLLQWIANIKTKEALSLAKNDKAKAEKYKNAVRKIENAVYQITDMNVQFELEEEPLSVIVKYDNEKIDFSLLPDGLKSIISWIADLLMKMDRIQWEGEVEIFDRSFVLFLDEIEVHLHPAWQRKILPVIKRLFKNAQIFISTHSPFVVGSVDGAWVYRLKKEGKRSVLDGEPLLSEDAVSYETILEDVFNVKDQFGVAVTKDLKEFKSLKKAILSHTLPIDDPAFTSLSNSLSVQSIELSNIIGMEVKQLNRLMSLEQI